MILGKIQTSNLFSLFCCAAAAAVYQEIDMLYFICVSVALNNAPIPV